jgi:hypothetical protein
MGSGNGRVLPLEPPAPAFFGVAAALSEAGHAHIGAHDVRPTCGRALVRIPYEKPGLRSPFHQAATPEAIAIARFHAKAA